MSARVAKTLLRIETEGFTAFFIARIIAGQEAHLTTYPLDTVNVTAIPMSGWTYLWSMNCQP